ncbi:MAG: epoxyqueuosine reductase QueH [Deltaproteobacteria bacterium]
MKLLLHVCCGPCAVYPLEMLKGEKNMEILGLFYNPNIHPYTEYKARLNSAEMLFQKPGIAFEELDSYGLDLFLKQAAFSQNRCRECYSIRMDKIAKEASKRNCDAFSTTLLVSPYQKHDMLSEIAKEAGKKYGIEFYYRDFREGFREGQAKARDLGLYMQKYCGCILSEQERYMPKRSD